MVVDGTAETVAQQEIVCDNTERMAVLDAQRASEAEAARQRLRWRLLASRQASAIGRCTSSVVSKASDGVAWWLQLAGASGTRHVSSAFADQWRVLHPNAAAGEFVKLADVVQACRGTRHRQPLDPFRWRWSKYWAQGQCERDVRGRFVSEGEDVVEIRMQHCRVGCWRSPAVEVLVEMDQITSQEAQLGAYWRIVGRRANLCLSMCKRSLRW